MKIISKNDFQSIQEEKLRLEVMERERLEKALTSSDPEQVVKAYKYIKEVGEREDSKMKSYIFPPDRLFYNSLGYKYRPESLSFELLRSMASTPVIRSIINTRIDQIASFCEWSTDMQRQGWTIRKKQSLFVKPEEKDELTSEDEKKIEQIATFIQDGGIFESRFQSEDFETFLRKIARDSLEVDQMCFEIPRFRNGLPQEMVAVDGATFRLAESIDNEANPLRAPEINGFLPSYVQVYMGKVVNEYYPWELCFGIRNPTTSVTMNGYGTSELETLVKIVTWLLYGFQYNGNYFTQGSSPKGFLSIKGNLDQSKILEFREQWRNTLAGTQNSHRIPVLEGGADVQWIQLAQSNKDMEFNQWLEFLIIVTCSVYRIDPTECGYNLEKGRSTFGQDGQKERLKHSQSKGLTPLLRFIEKKINKFVVSSIDDRFEFLFTGIEIEDEATAIDMDVKKINSGVISLQDAFRKYSGREFDPDNDIILNPAFLQYKQMQMMGGEQSNMAVDEMNEEDPFEGYNENAVGGELENEEDPFTKGLTDYINKEFTRK